jgi:nucleoside-diphosphate-sugar epimerase
MTGQILVTGATGFIGKHVVVSLLKDSRRSVSCLVRRTSNLDGINTDMVEIRYGDLTNQDSVMKAMRGISKVVHLGAAVGQGDHEQNQLVNVEGSRYVIEACKRFAVRQVIFISSLNAKLGIGSYGMSKREAEQLFLSSTLNVTILRPGLVFGKEGTQFGTFVKSVKDYPFIPLIGKGMNLVQPIDVDDLAEVIVRLLTLGHSREQLYEIGGRDSVTTRKLLGHICDRLHQQKPFVPVPLWMLGIAARVLGTRSPVNKDQLRVMMHDLIADNQPLMKELHIKLTPLEQMLDSYLARQEDR